MRTANQTLGQFHSLINVEDSRADGGQVDHAACLADSVVVDDSASEALPAALGHQIPAPLGTVGDLNHELDASRCPRVEWIALPAFLPNRPFSASLAYPAALVIFTSRTWTIKPRTYVRSVTSSFGIAIKRRSLRRNGKSQDGWRILGSVMGHPLMTTCPRPAFATDFGT